LLNPDMAKALLLVGLGLGWGCSPAPSEPSPAPSTTTSARTANPDTRRVVVVINTKSPDSQAVGAYYMDKRGIPADAAILRRCGHPHCLPAGGGDLEDRL